MTNHRPESTERDRLMTGLTRAQIHILADLVPARTPHGRLNRIADTYGINRALLGVEYQNLRRRIETADDAPPANRTGLNHDDPCAL